MTASWRSISGRDRLKVADHRRIDALHEADIINDGSWMSCCVPLVLWKVPHGQEPIRTLAENKVRAH